MESEGMRNCRLPPARLSMEPEDAWSGRIRVVDPVNDLSVSPFAFHRDTSFLGSV